MDREELIATVTKITELRAEVARLSGLREELKRWEAKLDALTGATPSAVPTTGRRSFSIEEKIAQFLENNADHEWSAEEVAHRLGVKVPTTRAVFSKLRKADRIVNRSRGHVQAKRNIPTESKEEDHDLIRAA